MSASSMTVAEAVEMVCDIAERSGDAAWLAGKWAAADRAFEAVEIIRGAATWLSKVEVANGGQVGSGPEVIE